jgi:ferredoxin--NADP+ reductase
VIPNIEGRVLKSAPGEQHSQEVLPGVYATGWIKRGPVGLIGHTKSDAMETIGHLVNDQANWWSPVHPESESITDLLESRGIRYTTIEGWHRLDEHERGLGEVAGRTRIKVVPRDEMVTVSRGE